MITVRRIQHWFVHHLVGTASNIHNSIFSVSSSLLSLFFLVFAFVFSTLTVSLQKTCAYVFVSLLPFTSLFFHCLLLRFCLQPYSQSLLFFDFVHLFSVAIVRSVGRLVGRFFTCVCVFVFFFLSCSFFLFTWMIRLYIEHWTLNCSLTTLCCSFLSSLPCSLSLSLLRLRSFVCSLTYSLFHLVSNLFVQYFISIR